MQRGSTLPDLAVQRPTLEEVYLRLTGAGLESPAAREEPSSHRQGRRLEGARGDDCKRGGSGTAQAAQCLSPTRVPGPR